VLDENYKLWEYEVKRERWESRDLFKLYPNLTEGVRGGSRSDQRLTWFFKGRHVWVYHDYTLLSGFPYRVPESVFPTHVYTSLWKDNKLYGMKDSFLYEFNTSELQGEEKNPEIINFALPGVPGLVQSTFVDKDSYYFFKDEMLETFLF
jgi:hypothetical protein